VTDSWTDNKARNLLRATFDAAIASANPAQAVLGHLPEKPKGRCIVVGAGKASAAMAAALDAAWADVELSGVIVTRYGYAVPAGRVRILEAAHPVPDVSSEMAASEILRAVRGLTRDDLVIALISGGGSSLMVLPAGRMTLDEKQRINRALLMSGATIEEMNVVRRHLSGIKGGKLALAARPARVVSLMISDVPGDDPAVIASGPTVPNTTTVEDALAIVERYRIDLPRSARMILSTVADQQSPEIFDADVRIIAAPSQALAAAASYANAAGVDALILGDAIEGEAHQLGLMMAGIAMSVRTWGRPMPPPVLLLSGGEATVTIGSSKPGKGGRNTEFLLGFAIAAKGRERIWAIAGDSDGIDGNEDAAGAIVTPDTLKRGKIAGLDARQYLSAHDSYSYFNTIGDIVRTGPTLTNVNDIRAILIA
jgi:hydroxypyruvate reductase